MATAELSKFAGILSAALSQHYLLGFEIAQLEFSQLVISVYTVAFGQSSGIGSRMHLVRKLTMNKASGGDGIPVELFQILEDDAVKVLHSIYQQIWKTQQWPQDWKMCFHSNSKGNAKEYSNYRTIALISHAS